MAKPQLEHGRVEIALDLFVAIMTADMENREMIVLTEVILQCYGPPKQRTALFSRADIAEKTGLSEPNANRAIKSLKAKGILHATRGASLKFNKDYESWECGRTPKGGKVKPKFAERLEGGLLRFARSALERFGDEAKTSGNRQSPTGLKTGAVLSPVGLETPSELSPTGLVNGCLPNGVYRGEPASSENAQVQPRPPQTPRIELNTNSIPPPNPPEGGMRAGDVPSGRTEDDTARIREAVALLESRAATRLLGAELARKHDRGSGLTIEGWRWLAAAREMIGCSAKLKGFGLLVQFARDAVPSDLARPVKPASPPIEYHRPTGPPRRYRGQSDPGTKGVLP